MSTFLLATYDCHLFLSLTYLSIIYTTYNACLCGDVINAQEGIPPDRSNFSFPPPRLAWDDALFFLCLAAFVFLAFSS